MITLARDERMDPFAAQLGTAADGARILVSSAARPAAERPVVRRLSLRRGGPGAGQMRATLLVAAASACDARHGPSITRHSASSALSPILNKVSDSG